MIDFNDVVVLVGLLMLFSGLALMSWAAALAVTGAIVLGIGLAGALRRVRKP